MASARQHALEFQDILGTGRRTARYSQSRTGKRTQVREILGSQRGDPERNARQVDALTLAQLAAIEHPAEAFSPRDALNAKFDQPIGKQDTVSWTEPYAEEWKLVAIFAGEGAW